MTHTECAICELKEGVGVTLEMTLLHHWQQTDVCEWRMVCEGCVHDIPQAEPHGCLPRSMAQFWGEVFQSLGANVTFHDDRNVDVDFR